MILNYLSKINVIFLKYVILLNKLAFVCCHVNLFIINFMSQFYDMYANMLRTKLSPSF